MANTLRTTRQFPRDQAPGASVLKAAEAQDARRRRALEARQHKAEEVTDAARRKLRDLLGKQTSLDLRKLMQRETQAFRDRLQPPSGLSLDVRKANLARKAKATAFLRSQGIDQAKLAKITADASAALRKVLVPDSTKVVPGYNLSLHAVEWGGLSPNNLVLDPGDPDPNDPHRWLVFAAPYLGKETGFWTAGSDDAEGSATTTVTMATGLVAVEPNSLVIEDAGNINTGGSDAYAAVMCWFEAPATGLVEVLIDAQNLDCEHELRTENEWGFSNSWTEQTNHLMLKLLHPSSPDPSYALMSRFYLDTDETQTTREYHLNRGQHYFAHLYGDGPVQAGEHVYIAVGTHSYDVCNVSDVGIDSQTTFRWFIKSVQARISP